MKFTWIQEDKTIFQELKAILEQKASVVNSNIGKPKLRLKSKNEEKNAI